MYRTVAISSSFPAAVISYTAAASAATVYYFQFLFIQPVFQLSLQVRLGPKNT